MKFQGNDTFLEEIWFYVKVPMMMLMMMVQAHQYDKVSFTFCAGLKQAAQIQME